MFWIRFLICFLDHGGLLIEQVDSWNLANEYHEVLLEIKEEAQRLAPVELQHTGVSENRGKTPKMDGL